MAWPQNRILGSGYLDEQLPLPGPGHAVTMVGYKSATGQLNDAVFVFKNSYGPTWGQGGYGYATYRYLSQHLDDGLIIEVQPGDDARAKAAGK
jgi:C1A family cysteine protease